MIYAADRVQEAMREPIGVADAGMSEGGRSERGACEDE
jgi:hypothetical protein